MFNFEMIDMVPAGTIQDMVRAKGPDVLLGLMEFGRSHFEVAPDELLSFHLFETTNPKGERTIGAVPIVLDKQLRTLRKLPYYDLPQLLQTAPIATMIRQAKDTKKVMDKALPILDKVNEAIASGDHAAVNKHATKLRELLKDVPAALLKTMGLETFGTVATAEPAQLPAAPAQLPAAVSGGTAPATDGDEQP